MHGICLLCEATIARVLTGSLDGYPSYSIAQAEKNKSRSGSPVRDEVSGEAGDDDGGEGIGGEDEGGGTDLEHDPNETMEDYEAALDTET